MGFNSDEETTKTVVLNDQGGSSISVTYGVVNTLRAQDHNHPPLVLQEIMMKSKKHTPRQTAYGFKPEQSAQARSLGYEKEKSPTLSTLVPAILIIEKPKN